MIQILRGVGLAFTGIATLAMSAFAAAESSVYVFHVHQVFPVSGMDGCQQVTETLENTTKSYFADSNRYFHVVTNVSCHTITGNVVFTSIVEPRYAQYSDDLANQIERVQGRSIYGAEVRYERIVNIREVGHVTALAENFQILASSDFVGPTYTSLQAQIANARSLVEGPSIRPLLDYLRQNAVAEYDRFVSKLSRAVEVEIATYPGRITFEDGHTLEIMGGPFFIRKCRQVSCLP